MEDLAIAFNRLIMILLKKDIISKDEFNMLYDPDEIPLDEEIIALVEKWSEENG